MKTESAHLRDFTAERANVQTSGLHSAPNGRSYYYATCPWCQHDLLCYPWSMAGSGKRCPYCKAFHFNDRSAVKAREVGPYGATFSVEDPHLGHEARRYRYALWRKWNDDLPPTVFIGLNPSTADEETNDRTVTRCINFAYDWGFGGMIMLNVFAFRATDRAVMLRQGDPVGDFGDEFIWKTCSKFNHIVCCWGNDGAHRERSARVVEILRNIKDWGTKKDMEIKCFGRNSTGEPEHPLYLARTTKLQTFIRC